MANPLPKLTKVVFRIPTGTGTTDVVEVDAVVSEQHTLSNKITDHPVEQGANVSDHSRPDPRRVTLQCVHTNTPLSGADGSDRAREMWLRFVRLHESPQLIAVDTIRDTYTSMAVESVSTTVDVKSAQAFVFTVVLKQIRVVQNKFVQIKPTKDTRGQGNKKKGKQTEKSAAASLTDGIAGWLK